MVNIITGGSDSVREDLFTDKIKEAAQQGRDVLVIVPDQFSFDYEKKLYDSMGAKLFNGIRTAGFNRLAEKITEKYGGYSRENAGDNARMILMYKAVRRFSKEGGVKFYKKSLDKGSFISELIDLTGKLRQSGVTPDDLALAADRLEGTVSLKLADLSRLFRYYLDELDNAQMKDEVSEMAAAAELAKEREYFKGADIFVSSFNSFTYDEEKIIDLCISQGAGFTISLLMDNDSVKSFHSHSFAVTVRTEQQITDMAKAHNKSINMVLADRREGRSYDIGFLGRELFNYSRAGYAAQSEDVKIFSADDVYEETDLICAEICRLVREENYRFSDIACTARDLSKFAPVLESTFEKYDIPYYTDRRESVSSSAIVNYINALFRTVLTKEFRTADIMKLIKSPLFGILEYDVTDLEEYCIKWNVDRQMWLAPFTAPAGEQSDSEERKAAKLQKINDLRVSIIQPLLDFKTAAADATAKEICTAFYKLLGDIKLSEQTYSLVKRAGASQNETETELSRELKQLWTMCLSAVRSIYEILGDDKISLRQYYELYRLMLSQMKISNPPQKLDCVRLLDAVRSRTDGVKVMFAAEVNDGIFPAPAGGAGLVSEHEKEMLRLTQDIDIRSGAMNDFQNERLAAYTALSSAEEKLYILYSGADLLGNEKRPSMLVKEVTAILGTKVRKISSLPAEFFCTSYKTAYTKYIEHSRDKTAEMQSIYDSVMGSPLYYDKLCGLRKKNSSPKYTLAPEKAAETFFKGEISPVSPTKLDNYYKCPFMYFCNYGLHLSKIRQVKVDGLSAGNIIHGLLEKILKKPDSEEYDTNFVLMTDDEIKDFIRRHFEECYAEELGGDFGKDAGFDFRYKKLEQKAFYIVKFVQNDIKKGSFVPCAFEYKLWRDPEEGGSLALKLKDGRKIVLTGTVDRADIYTDKDGVKYLRIIDYKTGSTTFDLRALYHGLNLQMLVYLSDILETQNEINREDALKQAGVIYFNFKETAENRADSGCTDEELEETQTEHCIKGFKRTGRLVDRADIVKAMDLSTRYKVTDRKFSAMREYAKRKVAEYGNRLLEGDIAAEPYEGVCSYCDYSGICAMAVYTDENTDKPAETAAMEEILDEIANELDAKVSNTENSENEGKEAEQ